MNVAERVARIQEEIRGVASQYGVTSWERTFLEEHEESRSLSPKQEAILREIEVKVFGEGDDA